MFFESKVWNNFNDLQLGTSGLRAEGLQRQSGAFWVGFMDDFMEFVYNNKHLWPQSPKKKTDDKNISGGMSADTSVSLVRQRHGEQALVGVGTNDVLGCAQAMC